MAKGKKPTGIATTARPVTRSQIVAAVEQLESAVKAWEHSNDETLLVTYRGRQVRSISMPVEQAANALFELLDTTNVDRDAWPLALAIDEFDDEMGAFADRCSVAPHDTDPHGTPALWSAYLRVIEAKTPPRPHKLEPIAQLLAEGVNRHQIAKMYGFARPDGTPDLDRLQAEITAPGTHYDPATFEHPKDKKFWAAIEEKWLARLADFEKSAAESDVKSRKKEAAETLEELILAGVNVDQITKMKGIDAESVRQRAAEMGVALDGGSLVYATYQDAQRAMAANRQAGLQNAMNLSRLNTHVELGNDRNGRIAAMSADGHPPRVILDALKSSFADLRYQDVAYALAKSQSKLAPVDQDEAAEVSGDPLAAI